MADSANIAICIRCRTHDACVPVEEQLRALATEDWSPADEAFHPRAMNQEQAVAAEMLTAALGRYVKAFGLELAGARLGAMLATLRVQSRTSRVMARILEAREPINLRAREQYERGDIAAAQAIEAEQTPEYPGRDRDMLWLAYGVEHARK